MYSAPYYHPDFKDSSHYIAIIYDRLKEALRKATGYKYQIGKVLTFPVSITIFFIAAIIFTPVLAILLGVIKALNWRLAHSVNRVRMDFDNLSSYASSHELLETTEFRLKNIQVLYDEVLIKQNVFLKKPMVREIEKSISLLQAYIDAQNKALQQCDKPLLPNLGKYVVKEADLWKGRTKAYEYIM